jgi:gas vesicle protein
MNEMLTSHFAIGLYLGLAVAIAATFAAWRSSYLKRKPISDDLKRVSKELEDMKRHLNRQMAITAKGNEETEKELKELKEQNENLRSRVAALQQKPDRAELRMLHIYDHAIHVMYEKAPGFAPVWENAVAEGEAHVAQADKGLASLFKRVVRPALNAVSGGGSKAIEAGEDESSKAVAE